MDQNQNNNLFGETPPPDNTQNQGGPQVYQVPVGEPYTPPTPPPPPAKSNKTIWIIVGVVVVILLCCCCSMAAFLWFFGDAIIQSLEELDIESLVPVLVAMI